MVYLPSPEGGHDPNFPAHLRNYLSFLTLLKWSTILTAIIGGITILIIAN
jgi:hypothetical protein